MEKYFADEQVNGDLNLIFSTGRMVDMERFDVERVRLCVQKTLSDPKLYAETFLRAPLSRTSERIFRPAAVNMRDMEAAAQNALVIKFPTLDASGDYRVALRFGRLHGASNIVLTHMGFQFTRPGAKKTWHMHWAHEVMNLDLYLLGNSASCAEGVNGANLYAVMSMVEAAMVGTDLTKDMLKEADLPVELRNRLTRHRRDALRIARKSVGLAA
ncbi:MAG: hypothetical protein Q4P78_04695 [Rothia sp. (in: high G+C Gram-positive bacteria)]|uniref:hypothetical protein n=1 Tax=Rothia sp. (in: high G+C Gram-positive bacteria) TaxID=1885016 RepID=UPI0026DEC73D|nr:hypothetical protein [Rothia sp. (in: high G+C Gram-positive bacteria)]MDO5750489.1 hypothetical protein [Rothia sp. (in: high G+C Gram-positive bacteria)]